MTLFFLNRNSMPRALLSTTLRLRSWALAMSSVGSPTSMPRLPASRISSSTEAVCSSALVGMQPRWQAGAAELGVLLDHRDLQAELPGADARDVAARAAADDDQVELFSRHRNLRYLIWILDLDCRAQVARAGSRTRPAPPGSGRASPPRAARRGRRGRARRRRANPPSAARGSQIFLFSRVVSGYRS